MSKLNFARFTSFTAGLSLFLALSSTSWAGPTQVSIQLLQSGKIDLASDTIAVPLHMGLLKDGRNVLFVLLDSSDQAQAMEQGLVYAPALANAAMAPSTRTAAIDQSGMWTFDHGTVDFSSNRSVTPGDAPKLFPPKAATPGSIGDSTYSPYVKVVTNGKTVIYNAPIIAFNLTQEQMDAALGTSIDHTLFHDKVIQISLDGSEVLLGLSHGFASGKPLVYVSLESNDPVASAVEGATYAPALNELKSVGATLPLFAVVNGATGTNNPNRQGLDSALMGEGSPLNVLTGIPTLSQTPYSPLWDLHLTQWTDAAINGNERTVLTDAQDFSIAYGDGVLTSFGGTGLSSSGLLVNCPAVGILQ
jgi:hypothetical protein